MAILHSHHSLCNCITTKYVGLQKELYALYVKVCCEWRKRFIRMWTVNACALLYAVLCAVFNEHWTLNDRIFSFFFFFTFKKISHRSSYHLNIFYILKSTKLKKEHRFIAKEWHYHLKKFQFCFSSSAFFISFHWQPCSIGAWLNFSIYIFHIPHHITSIQFGFV